MRFAVETTGRVWATDEVLDEAAVEAIFDRVAAALAELSELEADVAANVETAQLEFYVVVDAPDSREAFALANTVMDRALAGVEGACRVERSARPPGRPRPSVGPGRICRRPGGAGPL